MQLIVLVFSTLMPMVIITAICLCSAKVEKKKNYYPFIMHVYFIVTKHVLHFVYTAEPTAMQLIATFLEKAGCIEGGQVLQ